MRLCRLVFWSIFVAVSGCIAGESTPTPDQIAFFEKDVLPLLKTSCFKCHGAEAKVKAGLYLTSRAGMLRGGQQGPVLNEKEPAKSLFIEMLSFKDDDHSMPPTGRLEQAKIDTFTKWIMMGAPWKSGMELPLPEAKPVAKVETEQKVKTAEDW